MNDDEEWYYNTATGEVERGPKSPMQYRIGPYKTRELAQKALEIAKENNRKWDEQDRRWGAWDSSEH